MFTVRSYTGNGPYFAPTEGVYQAAGLRDMLFHTRKCMEDCEYQIGLFDPDGQCKGIWVDEAEPFDNGEGRMVMGKSCYTLYRPGDIPAGLWNIYLSNFKRV